MSTSDRSNTEHNGNTYFAFNESTTVATPKIVSVTDLRLRAEEDGDVYEYDCHAEEMAQHSTYINSLAAAYKYSSAAVSRPPLVIELQDIAPRTLALMIVILRSQHRKPPRSTLNDLVLAAEAFDKYEFAIGFVACDRLILTNFRYALGNFDDSYVRQRMRVLLRSARRCRQIPLKESQTAISQFLYRYRIEHSNEPNLSTVNSSRFEENENENTVADENLRLLKSTAIKSTKDLKLIPMKDGYRHVYPCHADFIAEQSPDIGNAVLAKDRARQPRIIELPGVYPGIFPVMMNILKSQHEVPPDCDLHGLFLAAEGFIQHGFAKGRLACDILISREYIQALQAFGSDPMQIEEKQLGDLISQSVRFCKLQLKRSEAAILNFLRRVLKVQEDGSHFGPLTLNEDLIGCLAEVIAVHKLLDSRWTKQQILDPSFPKKFLKTSLCEHENIRFSHLCERINFVTVELETDRTLCTAVTFVKAGSHNGSPYFSGWPCSHDFWDDKVKKVRLVLMRETDICFGDWVIGVENILDREAEAEDWKILWRSTMSHNLLNAPPLTHWVHLEQGGAPAGTITVVPYIDEEQGCFSLADDSRILDL